jgi:hypothetical protein
MLCRMRRNGDHEQRGGGEVDGSFIIRVRKLGWCNSGERLARADTRTRLSYTARYRFALLLVAVESF